MVQQIVNSYICQPTRSPEAYMLPGIDPLLWKHVSYWLGLGAEKLNESIEDASMVQFGVLAIVVVATGLIFLRTQKFY